MLTRKPLNIISVMLFAWELFDKNNFYRPMLFERQILTFNIMLVQRRSRNNISLLCHSLFYRRSHSFTIANFLGFSNKGDFIYYRT